MMALAHAEWLRLRRRTDIWIVLLLVVGLNVVGYIGGLSSAASIQFGLPGEELPPDMVEQMEQMRRDALAAFAFSQSIAYMLSGGRVLLFVVAAYLAAAVTGAEFEYGTIRTSLVVRGDRRGFVLVRLVAVTAITGVLLLLTVLVSIVLPLIAAAAGTDFPPVTGPSAVQVLGMIAATVLTAAFVVGLTTLVALALRSAIIALVLTLAATLVDGAIVGLVVRFFGEDAPARWITPLANAQLLFDRASGNITGPWWPSWLAILVAIGWATLVWVVSVRTLARADIRS